MSAAEAVAAALYPGHPALRECPREAMTGAVLAYCRGGGWSVADILDNPHGAISFTLETMKFSRAVTTLCE